MVPSRSISLSLVYDTSDIRIRAAQSFISNLGGLTGQTSCCLGNVSVKIWFQFNVSVTILLQHRGEICNFPGLKSEDGRGSISQTATDLLALSGALTVYTSGRCIQQIKVAIPHCATR